MENSSTKLRKVYGALLGSSFSIVFIAFSTIYGEFNHVFKDWLKETFFHHWIGKGVIAVIIFLILWPLISIIVKHVDYKKIEWAIYLLSWLTILGTIAILAFFIIHTL